MLTPRTRNRFRILFSLMLILSGTLPGCKKTDGINEGAGGSGGGDSDRKPIVVIGFDESDDTLQGIVDGEVYGTVVQNPYRYGYESVEMLAAMNRGEEVEIPAGGAILIPARQIRRENAEALWKEKKDYLKAGAGDAENVDGRDAIAYVTNGVDPFWTIAAAGAKAAGREFEVNVELAFPTDGIVHQTSMLEALLVRDDVKGIAVSPIQPENQQQQLNEIGEAKLFITHDSDAPQTNRLAYIGMDNYKAGRLCGQLVKEALPEGGSVMIFVGRLGQLNAEQRRQGVIDELLDRTEDATRRDDPNEVLEGDKYTILGTLTDDFDKVKAKQNAQDAISKYPDLGCMVGLFAYNPPACLQAVQEVGREVRVDVDGE